ncbi:MmpS family transport accessory protein [Nocardia sp. NPDC020380]|uniref:MmpS family transport accessory protein n=1 Tax=Nocardia sp. NPDC020380 TaxID=3364309 RepID=UPI0037A184B0
MDSERTVTIRYEVTGSADQGDTIKPSITYSTGEATTSQDTSAVLPWTKDVTLTGLLKLASLTAQAGDSDGATVTCRILQGDKVLNENTATGGGSIADCTADLSNIAGLTN